MNDPKHDKGSPEALGRLGLSHGDEYRLLRDEVMQRIKNIHQMELLSAIGVGLVYSWLILYKSICPFLLWFIGPCVVLLCGLSCLLNAIEMWRIGWYLERIEEVAFALDDKLMGWEHEQRHSKKQRRWVITHLISAFIYWGGALTVTILASIMLSRS